MEIKEQVKRELNSDEYSLEGGEYSEAFDACVKLMKQQQESDNKDKQEALIKQRQDLTDKVCKVLREHLDHWKPYTIDKKEMSFHALIDLIKKAMEE